jgi:hypothetical protein
VTGTGAMLKKLHNNEADLAITVTDGFIAGQASGYDVKLVGTYVDSPLTWAVSAHPASPYNSVEELFRNKDQVNVGVSRLQSGSHTMSYYMTDLLAAKYPNAPNPKHQLNFKELGSFSSLRNGILEKEIDIFLWEVFTTKPFFDSGDLKYIDEVSTPWPAFSIIASRNGKFNDSNGSDLFRNRFLPALVEGTAIFKSNTLSSSSSPDDDSKKNLIKVVDNSYEDSVSLIMKRFGHRQFDAKRWLDMTQYSLPDMSVDARRMANAVQTLKRVGLVPGDYSVSQLWGESGCVEGQAAVSFRQPFSPAGEEQKKKITSLMHSELW